MLQKQPYVPEGRVIATEDTPLTGNQAVCYAPEIASWQKGLDIQVVCDAIQQHGAWIFLDNEQNPAILLTGRAEQVRLTYQNGLYAPHVYEGRIFVARRIITSPELSLSDSLDQLIPWMVANFPYEHLCILTTDEEELADALTAHEFRSPNVDDGIALAVQHHVATTSRKNWNCVRQRQILVKDPQKQIALVTE